MRKTLILITLTLITLILLPQANAQDIIYTVQEENVTLIINPDTTITLIYNITIKVHQGTIRRYVDIGMPNPHYKVIEAIELDTNTPADTTEYHDKNECKVRIHPPHPINQGQTKTYLLKVQVYNHIYQDETNPGNAGLIFKPSWYPVEVEKLTLTIILPPGVKPSEVKNQPDYDNIYTIQNRTALYWERHNLEPDEQLEVGVSFPQKYLTKQPPPPPKPTIGDIIIDIIAWIIAVGIIIWNIGIPVIIILAAIVLSLTRQEYKKPKLMIEALGPRKGLTAPEAAWLIESHKPKPDYTKILTMILYGLILKKAVKITSTSPLKLQKTQQHQKLRYYERRFLHCIKPDGTLKQNCLIKVLDTLDKTVARKIAGYNTKETIQYYKKIVNRAWRQVQQAKTPQLKLKRLEQNLQWIMLDPEYNTKLPTILQTPDIVVIQTDSPLHPITTTTNQPTQTTLPQLAHQLTTQIEQTTQNIVTNIEQFTKTAANTIEHRTKNPQTKHRSITSSCACVSCACACACVSCACACASGGAG